MYPNQLGQQNTTAVSGYASGYDKLTATDVPGRAPELPHAIEKLACRLQELREAIRVLDSRLSGTVARPPSPTESAKGQIKGAMNTGFGQQIDNMHDETMGAYLQVRDLSDRLEF